VILKSDQGQLFYEFRLGDAVPEDHLVRKIDAALDLSWLRSELAPHYSSTGRPSIDPELMIRMLVVGYVFAIRSERLICREVQVNLAYRWFCRLGIEDAVPDHSAFSRARNERFREGDVLRSVFERIYRPVGSERLPRHAPDARLDAVTHDAPSLTRPSPSDAAKFPIIVGAGRYHGGLNVDT
jgi:transposase